MNIRKIVLRNLIYYRRTHSGTVLGTALAAAILIGALMVGDSVRYSLRKMVDLRLGRTEFVLETGNRYFLVDLAGRLSARLHTPVTSVLQTEGIGSSEKSRQRATGVRIVGITPDFNELAGGMSSGFDLDGSNIVINKQLADQLGVSKGDQLLLRLRRIDYLPKDAPLTKDTHLTISARYKIKSIADADQFGNFNLRTNQTVPLTVFISITELNRLLELDGAANTLLIAEREEKPIEITELSDVLEKTWMLEDAGLQLKKLPGQSVPELRSKRIFLEPAVVQAVQSLSTESRPVFTYFVNEISAGSRSTPYSFVSAPGNPLTPGDLQNNEIIINDWLARDLKISKGEVLQLKYYVPGQGRELAEESKSFRVKSIVPLTGRYADKSLMPEFPGLADVENCRDWQPGIPLDLKKIRRKDEKYWDIYRGIPKAFISIHAAQSMWTNRFGELTAVRFPDREIPVLKAELQKVLKPRDLGMKFRNVRREGINASLHAVSFSELFLGLSFFVVFAALLLTALFAIVTVEQRSGETGLFLALGLPRVFISRIMITETALLHVIGSILGIFLAVFYNIVILEALKTVWKGAVGTSALHMSFEWTSVFTGMTAGFLTSFLSSYYVIKKQAKKNVINLLHKIRTIPDSGLDKKRSTSFYIGWLALLAATGIILLSPSGQNAAGSFFTAGTLLLISSLAFLQTAMRKLSRRSSVVNLNLNKLAVRNAFRSRLRSLMLVGLLAGGLFIIFTVGANRHSELQDWQDRASGTGGFTIYAESVMPVLYELGSEKGRSMYNLQEAIFDSLIYLPFRRYEGDDASCLNLNRVTNPQLLGVNPGLLFKRGSFTFNSIADGFENQSPWLRLKDEGDADVIPGIADETVIIWGLGKAVGDTLVYVDETGRIFYIKLIAGLANSVFQGNIIISENNFLKKYPSVNGHRLFLIDTYSRDATEVAGRLSWAMADFGFKTTPAAKRLMAFNDVENTYLSIFLILGGFGVLLGTLGIGIVVFRSTMERRNELALLRAVGFKHRTLITLLVKEHLFLLLIGAFCGAVTSLLAALPVWLTPGSQFPAQTILVIFILVILSGGLWTVTATRIVLSQNLISALRLE